MCWLCLLFLLVILVFVTRLSQLAATMIQCYMRRCIATNQTNAIRLKHADKEWDGLFGTHSTRKRETRDETTNSKLIRNRFRQAVAAAKLEYIHHADMTYSYVPHIVRHAALRSFNTNQRLKLTQTSEEETLPSSKLQGALMHVNVLGLDEKIEKARRASFNFFNTHVQRRQSSDTSSGGVLDMKTAGARSWVCV